MGKSVSERISDIREHASETMSRFGMSSSLGAGGANNRIDGVNENGDTKCRTIRWSDERTNFNKNNKSGKSDTSKEGDSYNSDGGSHEGWANTE